jgi:hypothetical protein
MFEELNDVNLDPTIRPPSHDRLFKLALGASALLLVAVAVYFVTRVDIFPDTVTVTNDTGGSVVCYERISNHGGDFIRSSGRIAAGANAKIVADNNCAVFDPSGRYTACLMLGKTAPSDALASTADRSVATETCVYPQ